MNNPGRIAHARNSLCQSVAHPGQPLLVEQNVVRWVGRRLCLDLRQQLFQAVDNGNGYMVPLAPTDLHRLH